MKQEIVEKLKDESLSLEEKLELIQQLSDMKVAENQVRVDLGMAPIDPAEATMCEGCQ